MSPARPAPTTKKKAGAAAGGNGGKGVLVNDIRTVEAGAQRNVTHLYAGLSGRGSGT